ncbi:MAG: hypothetical protein AAF488_18505, partial [Planctomycetota bacterium]
MFASSPSRKLAGLLVAAVSLVSWVDARALAQPQTPDAKAGIGAPVPSVRVEQVATGLPGSRPGDAKREVSQVFVVSDRGDRIRYEQRSRAASPTPDALYLLRLDRKPAITWDIKADGVHYEDKTGDLSTLQKERNRSEREILRRIRRLSQEEQDFILDKNHLRPGLQREVKAEWKETQKILGHSARRLLVTENDRVIVD